MNLMTQRRPCEPVAHGSDAMRTGSRRTASGDARHRQDGSPAVAGIRNLSPGFQPPCRRGSHAFQNQQAQLSGMDARPVADRPRWVAGGARGTRHPQAGRGSGGYPQVCSHREKSRNAWHLGYTPRARRGGGPVWEGLMRDRAAGVVKPLPAAALAAALALLLVTGCNDPASVDPRATASSTTSAPSTATPSPSPSETRSETPQERDARLAGEAVVNLWKVVGELARDPGQDPGLLDTVARDQAKTQWRVVLDSYTAKGLLQQGSASVTDVQARTKDGKTFAVTACVDVSNVDLVDDNGNSQVNPKRPDRQKYTYRVAKTTGGFFVTVDTLKGVPC